MGYENVRSLVRKTVAVEETEAEEMVQTVHGGQKTS